MHNWNVKYQYFLHAITWIQHIPLAVLDFSLSCCNWTELNCLSGSRPTVNVYDTYHYKIVFMSTSGVLQGQGHTWHTPPNRKLSHPHRLTSRYPDPASATHTVQRLQLCPRSIFTHVTSSSSLFYSHIQNIVVMIFSAILSSLAWHCTHSFLH